MKFSIIIPAYNEEKYLAATLEKIYQALNSIQNQFEVIVVNNASKDKTVEIAESFGTQVVDETIHNIARVRNTGAKSATGDVLIFIDADTLVSVEVFQRIIEIMHNEKCFGGAVAVDYGEFQRKWMKLYSLGWKLWGNVFNMRGGAAQFCRKRIFHEIGGYDESIYLGEDVEFYWRVSRFAKRMLGFLQFIEDLAVTTSTRRFDEMGLFKTLLLTHPFYIMLNYKRKSAWKDWYDNAVR